MILYFIFGVCLGSFLLCVAMNWHAPRRLLLGHSKCEHCHTQLITIDLIPLISYVISRGRCRYCHTRISQLYFIAELMTGSLFTLLYIHLLNQSQVTLYPFVLIGVLILMAFCDLTDYWVPDLLQFALLCLIGYYHFFIMSIPLSSVLYTLWIAFALNIAYILKPNWIGGADIKLIILLSLLLAPNHFPLFLLLASLLGLFSFLFWPHRHLPFVPCLVLSFYTIYFYL